MLGLVIFLLWRRHRRGAVASRLGQRGVQTGPVPGYARIEPPHLATDRIRTALPAGLPPWEVLSFETFNTSDRKRSVLRISTPAFAGDTPDRQGVWTLAHLLGQIGTAMTGSDVVLVEVHAAPAPHLLEAPPGVVLLASDGRGWNGDVEGVRCVETCRSAEPALVDALPGTVSHPGFGWALPAMSPGLENR